MGHANLDAKPVRKFLKVLFEQVHGRAVAAAAIAQHQQFLGLGIVGPAMPLPPRLETVTGQFAGIVAGIQVNEALVLPHIIEAAWDHHACSSAAEIVIVGLDGFLRVDRAITVEIAQQFLLLGVHADDRQAIVQIIVLQAGDVLELGVAVWIAGTHRLLLQRLSPAVSVLAEQLGHHVSTGRSSQLSNPERDLPPRQVRPLHLRAHRIASGVVPEHLEKVLLEGAAALDYLFASTPFFRTRFGSKSSAPANSSNPRRIVLGSHWRIWAMYSIPPCPNLAASTAA